MGRKLGLAFFFVVMAVSLFATPAQALDLFPGVDLIPDPNLEDLPDLGPGYGGGSHRRDDDGVPDRRDLNPSVFGGAEDDTRFHRRHRDDDDPDEDQYAGRDQYTDASQYDARTGAESDARSQAGGGKSTEKERPNHESDRGERKVDAKPASAKKEGGGWLGTVVGVFVVLWLLGAVFGR